MQKMNVIAKINCYFNALSLHWHCAKNIYMRWYATNSLTPDEEL